MRAAWEWTRTRSPGNRNLNPSPSPNPNPNPDPNPITLTLASWFQSRRVLQEWVAQQPQVSSSSVRSMFYKEDGENEDGGDLLTPAPMPPPPLVPLRCV